MKHLWSIDEFVKKANVLQVETSKNLTTVFYSETTKAENFFEEKKAIKNAKITNDSMYHLLFCCNKDSNHSMIFLILH